MFCEATESCPVTDLPEPMKGEHLARLAPDLKVAYPAIFGESAEVVYERVKQCQYGFRANVAVLRSEGDFFFCEILGGSCEGCDPWEHDEAVFRAHVIDNLIWFRRESDAVEFAEKREREYTAEGISTRLDDWGGLA
jgi:hypothetical protein